MVTGYDKALVAMVAGYDKAMARFMLKKFLLLVLFLDHAKVARLVRHDPCLFRKDAPIKVTALGVV